MCRHGEKCNRKKTCNFAHNKDELQVVECVFGKNCRRTDCYFNHKYGRYIDQKPNNNNNQIFYFIQNKNK